MEWFSSFASPTKYGAQLVIFMVNSAVLNGPTPPSLILIYILCSPMSANYTASTVIVWLLGTAYVTKYGGGTKFNDRSCCQGVNSMILFSRSNSQRVNVASVEIFIGAVITGSGLHKKIGGSFNTVIVIKSRVYAPPASYSLTYAVWTPTSEKATGSKVSSEKSGSMDQRIGTGNVSYISAKESLLSGSRNNGIFTFSLKFICIVIGRYVWPATS